MVEQFRYVATTLTNQNSIQEDSKEQTEVKERLLSFGAASLSSSLLSKNIKIKIYRTVVLPFVFFYGCETWSITLREGRRLRLFENSVLRRIFGGKRDEVAGEWRKLHNKELNGLYCSPNVVWVIRSRRDGRGM